MALPKVCMLAPVCPRSACSIAVEATKRMRMDEPPIYIANFPCRLLPVYLFRTFSRVRSLRSRKGRNRGRTTTIKSIMFFLKNSFLSFDSPSRAM